MGKGIQFKIFPYTFPNVNQCLVSPMFLLSVSFIGFFVYLRNCEISGFWICLSSRAARATCRVGSVSKLAKHPLICSRCQKEKFILLFFPSPLCLAGHVHMVAI